MEGLDFAFTLFGLLLGLALTEGLSGLARAIKARHAGRIGWSTGLLGLFVACDVVTFWMYGWSLRKAVHLSWPLMFGGFVVTAIYYICASLIFPDNANEDFDEHFERNHRLVIGGVLLCNMALIAFTATLATIPFDLRTSIVTWSFFPVSLTAILAHERGVKLVCLGWLLLLYPLSVVWV